MFEADRTKRKLRQIEVLYDPEKVEGFKQIPFPKGKSLKKTRGAFFQRVLREGTFSNMYLAKDHHSNSGSRYTLRKPWAVTFSGDVYLFEDGQWGSWSGLEGYSPVVRLIAFEYGGAVL